MNKYLEAYEIIFDDLIPMPELNERNRDWLYFQMDVIKEACDKANKYDKLQKVYFKNEPMESADLNARKLQELYDFNNKLIDKETPKKPYFLNYGGYKIGNWKCHSCDGIVRNGDEYCKHCGQRLGNTNE